MNAKSNQTICLNGEIIEDVDTFTYLGSKMTADGTSDAEITSRLTKASQTFASLRNVWKCGKISTKTKIRLFKSNVLGTLLYGSESWKMTQAICQKLNAFQNRCLRRILKIFWPQTISNAELRAVTNTNDITTEVKRRRWTWIGHSLRLPQKAIPRVALHWTPDGKRNRGRPKETWRRTVSKELKDNNFTWGTLQHVCQDRTAWRSLVAALCAQGTRRTK